MTSIWEMINGDWQHVMNVSEQNASTMHTMIRKDEPHKLFKVSQNKPAPVR